MAIPPNDHAFVAHSQKGNHVLAPSAVNTNKRVIVFGATGLIGRHLAVFLRSLDHNVTCVGRRAGCDALYDLASPPQEWQFGFGPGIAYICSSECRLDVCRKNPVETRFVNVDATLALAEKCTRFGFRVVFCSSNQVFSGEIAFHRSDDAYDPRTEYGRQKRDAEQALLSLPGSVAIVRLTKVLSSSFTLFRQWRGASKRKQPIFPIFDLRMAPVDIDSAVDAIAHVGQKGENGVYQVSGRNDIDYETVARYFSQFWGGEHLILPVAAANSPIHFEHLPRHTTLDTTRVSVEFGFEAPDPRAVLRGIADDITDE
jgi:dTDP-4-dehydrorhamnose reductase